MTTLLCATTGPPSWPAPDVSHLPPRTAKARRGEALAAHHLIEQHRAVVLDRNWRCARGELDLVVRDHDVLVAVEVKHRSSLSHGHPLEAITHDKARRLRLLATLYARDRGAAHGWFSGLRIDVIAILGDLDGAVRIDHLAGVGA